MIVAGFGFRRSATMASLRSALDRAAGGKDVAALAAPADKAAAACFTALADALALPSLAVPAGRLAQAKTATRAPASLQARGVGSVAEAAALAAAGPGARLLGPRQISADRMATCALAVGERP